MINILFSSLNAAEFLGAEGVVEVEARPQEATAEDGLHLHVVLEAPAFAWLIFRDVLQEVGVENDARLVEELSLLLGLSVTEVLIVGQVERLRSVKALERLVAAADAAAALLRRLAANLMLRGHLEGAYRFADEFADGRNLAVVLNGIYYVVDAVDLVKVLRLNLDLFGLGDVAISLSGRAISFFSVLLFCLFSRFVALDLGSKVLVRLTDDEVFIVVDQSGVLVVKIRHTEEVEVIGEAPEEFLLRELKVSLVHEAHGNIIVGLQSYWRLPIVLLTGDFAPEHELIETLLFCMQRVQSHFELHPGQGYSVSYLLLVEVEVDAAVIQVRQLVIKVKYFHLNSNYNLKLFSVYYIMKNISAR